MVYIVEDDNSIRELVVYTLCSTGIEARGFERPSEFYEALNEKMPDLLMLDIMLPEEDGLSILEKMRKRFPKLPIILLTAKGTEYDKVIGFEKGADDYIPKPFGMLEMVARVKALLRRSMPEEAQLSFNELSVSRRQHTVFVSGRETILTLKEFELLMLLIENTPSVLTRDTILEKVWGYCFDGESRTVDVHIRTLRQKLCGAGYHVVTVRGVGYKFE